MATIKKILLMPWFGKFPNWMDKYEIPKGYDCILDTDIEKFKQRVGDKLGITFPGYYGGGKLHDYRGALGLLYEDEISSFDFWGHTDLDCVYGNVDKWVTDDFLSSLDVHSNHSTYVNGCWSLYRNVPEVNNLILTCPNWKENLTVPNVTGWIEGEYSQRLELSGLRYKYTFWQGNPWDRNPILKKEGDNLFQMIDNNWEEIMQFHFRHSKKHPL